MPPTKSQIALSVGEPVKNRETPELKEFETFKPQITKTTPTTSNTMDIFLFMFEILSLGVWFSSLP
jgi:hypothetical protein